MSTITNYITNNFVTTSILILGLGFIITLVLIYNRTDARLQFGASIATIMLLLVGFWVKISDADVRVYSYIIPISHLVVVFLSAFLLFNSISRYQISYSRIELRLIVFYLINFLVWFILFLQDIYTIGVVDPSTIWVLPYLGWILLMLSLGAALSIYYIGKSIFFTSYKGEEVVEALMLMIYGILIGLTISDIDDTLIINAEAFYQQTFFFPDLFKYYGIIILAFLFVPYQLVAFHARRAIKLMTESEENGGAIDPVAIPRLRLTQISMYVYLLGAGFAIGLTLLPGFVEGFRLPFGLNTVLSVPFIVIVDLTLFFAFQTPNWLKKRWRNSAVAGRQ